MDVLMISPGYPAEMAQFTRGLVQAGARVIGLGDQHVDALPPTAREAAAFALDVSGLIFDVPGVLYDGTLWTRWLFQLLSRMGMYSHFTAFARLWEEEYLPRVNLDGEDISERLEYYNDFYLRTFDYVLSKYEDQYPIFGNLWVAAHKLYWDAFFNHAGPVLLMVKNKIGDYEFMKSVDADLDRLYRLSMRMQELFKQWHELEQRDEENPLIRQAPGTLVRALLGLVRPMDDSELREDLRAAVKGSLLHCAEFRGR
jgi:hypothetical protein